MFSIRRGVFETNSSSTHSLTICTQEEFDKWKNEELIWDSWKDKLIDISMKDEIDEDYAETQEKYFDDEDYDTFEHTFTTPSGDKMVAFGKYGRDG